MQLSEVEALADSVQSTEADNTGHQRASHASVRDGSGALTVP